MAKKPKDPKQPYDALKPEEPDGAPPRRPALVQKLVAALTAAADEMDHELDEFDSPDEGARKLQ